MIQKISLPSAFEQIHKVWAPVIGGEINESHLKLAKFEGEFLWHSHEEEDELFLVTKGRLRIELRDQDPLILEPMEYAIVPRGVEHKPVAELPCEVVLLEPKSTVNTGGEVSSLTACDLARIET